MVFVVAELLPTVLAAPRWCVFQIVMPVKRTAGRETPVANIAAERAVRAWHRLVPFLASCLPYCLSLVDLVRERGTRELGTVHSNTIKVGGIRANDRFLRFQTDTNERLFAQRAAESRNGPDHPHPEAEASKNIPLGGFPWVDDYQPPALRNP